jgi:hypothetical protein
MIKRIEIYRSGSAVWVVIDGQALPADWIDEVGIGLSADADDPNSVTLMLHADTVMVDAGPVQADASKDGADYRVPEFVMR